MTDSNGAIFVNFNQAKNLYEARIKPPGAPGRSGRIYVGSSRIESEARLKAEAALRPYLQNPEPAIEQPATDKKAGEFSWREWSGWIKQGQALKQQASFSQDIAHIDFSHLTRPVAAVVISDWHWGSWGTDYGIIERVTDEILRTPDLYVIIAGDMEQQAIKLRNVLEVSDNVLPPEMQHRFTESWLEEIAPRVLMACWDNHAVMREESGAGYSRYADILKRNVIYHNGIGHSNVMVGGETYRFALSHRFRGGSELNPVHAQMKYSRFQAPDRDIIVQGDTHRPGFAYYQDGPTLRLALNSGAAQLNSGYGKRHFSLFTSPAFPVVELYPDVKQFTGYWTVEHWLRTRQGRV